MKKVISLAGKTFLFVSSLVAVVGIASLSAIAEEPMPNSIKNLR